MKDTYEDIIHLPHHVSKTRSQMSMADRAAQFSPFAALTGHNAAIRETSRLIEERIDLTEDRIAHLNRKLQILSEHLSEHPTVTFTCFQPDTKKQGGAYQKITGIVKRIDPTKGIITLEDNSRLLLHEICQMESDLFSVL